MPRTQIPTGSGGNRRVVEHNLYDLRNFIATTGNIWFVDSGAASGGNGLSPEGAVLTLDAGNNLATASNGDIVYVAEGHAENITGAAGLAADVAGVTFQGLGFGRARPVITFTTAIGAQITVSAANVTFRNLVFDLTGFDAITAAFSITGADCLFEDCEFITNSATAGVVLGILTAATATRLKVKRCQFLGAETNTGTTTTAHIKHEVGDDAEISDCFFTGKMTQAILNVTASVLRLRLLRNYIHTYTGTVAWTLSTTCTGFASDNRVCVASGTTPFTGAALSYSGNRYTTEGNGPTGGTADAL